MTRFAIVSDIHGNRFALEAVLSALCSQPVDGLICLGDIVGYGPHPAECLDQMVKYAAVNIQGNHDLAVVDPHTASCFNGAAREAVYWTRDVLGPLHLNALLSLKPSLRTGPNHEILCVHDSPAPGPTDYVHDPRIAAIAFRGVETALCLVGHTHIPMVFEAPDMNVDRELTALDITAYIPSDGHEVRLEADRRYICNPGSVGQPRDCDPRASYAILDLAKGTFTVHRLEYDIVAAQKATQEAGLPTVLADRLAIGA